MRWHRTTAGVAVALAMLAGSPIHAQADQAADEGAFITVANPIDSLAVNRVKEAVSRARKGGRLATVILDFTPGGKEAASPEFGPCSDLAEYLLEQTDVTTVAFLRGKVRRHTVLPVLACSQRVMGRDSRLGDVLADGETVRPRVRTAYEEVAQKRGGAGRVPLVLKMLDRNLEVLEGRKAGAVVYVDRAKRAEAERDGVSITSPVPVLGANSRADFGATEAQKFDLCNLVRDTQREVAERYGLGAATLKEDALGGRTPKVARVDAVGEIQPGMRDSLQRRIRRLVSRGANVVIVQINCAGGDLTTAIELGEFLRTLRDPSPEQLPVVTIAYAPKECPDLAHFIALGCSQLVLGKDCKLGDFDRLYRTPKKGDFGMANPDAVKVALAKLAEDQGYPPLLVEGFLTAEGEIVRARNAKGAVEQTFLTRDALDLDAKAEGRWKDEGTVKPAGQRLTLTAEQARELGLARYVVEPGTGVENLALVYGYTPGQIREAGPDWLDTLATVLSDPVVSWFLILLGIGCLILELKMPGVGLPGVIAAVCFVLYFWARSQTTGGNFTLLAVLLFLMGLALIAIEIFLIPGFGLTGISGMVLLLAGLALATLERLPQSGGEWGAFARQMTTFAGCLVAGFIGAFAVARFLPHIPYANRLVLVPPSESPDAGEPATAQHAMALALLGQFGTAATVLRPAGMAQFGEQYVDVVTEGGYVPAGARVQVIEIEGNRVVVKEV